MLNKDGGLLLIRGDYFTLVFDCFIRGVVVRRVVEVFDDAPQFGVIIGVCTVSWSKLRQLWCFCIPRCGDYILTCLDPFLSTSFGVFLFPAAEC